MNPYIPIIILVVANTVYHICSKSTSGDINAFASLFITYLIGAIVSLVLYFTTQKATNGSLNLINEYKNLNWASIVLGFAIVGLEVGFILMYRCGWEVSTGQLVQAAILAIVLVFVGVLLYKEAITLTKIAGIAICLIGLYLINKK